MKRILVLCLLCVVWLLSPFGASAQNVQTGEVEKISLSTKVPVSFYGFIDAQTIFTSALIDTFNSGNSVLSGYNNVQNKAIVGKDDASINFTPQSTRFGFLLSPYNFGDKSFSVDARIEFDFFSTANLSAASIAPRLRRAYAGIGNKSWHILAGQEWDIFSPLNPGTLNISGDMWTQGNLGFRRPQIQFTYNHNFSEKSAIEAAVSANLPSNSLQSNDPANDTGIPMFQGRFGYLHSLPAGKLKAYISAFFYRVNRGGGAAKFSAHGASASIDAPAHKFFQPSAEFQYGYGMNPFLSISTQTIRQRSISGWGNIKSDWLCWLETNLGYGIEMLKDADVAAAARKNNQNGFFNIRFKPVKDFVIGLQYDYMRTNWQGSGASSANVGSLNLLYFF